MFAASLRGRLLIAASTVLIAFLGTMGFALDNAFRSSAIEAVNARLLQRVYALLSVTEDAPSRIDLPDALMDPLLNQLDSGHYGYVLDEQARVLWQSQSALDQPLPEALVEQLLASAAVGKSVNGQIQIATERLRYLAFSVQWMGETHEARYTFVVIEDEQLLDAEVEGFLTRLWGWVVASVVLLLVLQGLIMRWGLKPIERFTADLYDMSQGKRGLLTGPYLQEFEPLAKTLNRLVDQERKQRERYRTTLADLAHSLKTPLAVIQNALQTATSLPVGEVTRDIESEVRQMDQVIAYQLSRAVIASSPETSEEVDPESLVLGLLSALGKVYADKSVQVQHQLEVQSCRADSRDLSEAWGNLLDNAYKYCHGQVSIVMFDRDDVIECWVEDDGPGVATDQQTVIMKRGVRLDVKPSGHGIGLAVVSEIAERYEGEVSVSRSERLGGARFCLTLKLAR